MKLWAPDSGNGSGGDATATPVATPPAAESVLGGKPADATATPPAADAAKVETKPAEGETKVPGAESKDPKAETKPPPAPVDDKWEPKALEGVTRDTKVLGEARELFKKLGLNAEQAQALTDFSDAQAKASQAAAEKFLADEDAGFKKELEADPDIGGQKLKAAVESSRRLIRSLKSGDALATWLEDRGLGNAPPLVRAFAELAARTAEDTVKDTVKDPGGAAIDEHERRISRTYGNTNRKES